MEETTIAQDKTRRKTGILLGIFLFLLSVGFYGIALFMVSLSVFGCVKSPPDWIYLIVAVGFPIPLIITTIVVPYLYISRQKWPWIVLCIAAGIFLSCVVYLIFFITLTRYC